MSPMNILKNRIPLRQFAPAAVLILDSLVWFTLLHQTLSNLVDNMALTSTENMFLHGVYYAGIAVAAVPGALVSIRKRENYLFAWMLFGSLMTALPAIIISKQIYVNALILGLAGASVGFGLPSCLAYFADSTAVENRGTYGGIAWSAVGFSVLGFALGISSLGLSTFQTLLALAVWRAAGLPIFFILSKLRETTEQSPSRPSYGAILRRRDVALYLLPWIMFSIINFAEVPIVDKGLNVSFAENRWVIDLIGFIEFAISGIFAAVGGLVADQVGRKRVVITGFVILGIEYAVLSLFSEIPASWYVYTVCDGIAWGMFASVFFMTLWGDLAQTSQKDKFYVLGGLSYLLASFIPVLVNPFAQGIETTTAFSIASFFLFIAVLPLVYAPETLPEKKILERELRDYVERAKKAKEKYA